MAGLSDFYQADKAEPYPFGLIIVKFSGANRKDIRKRNRIREVMSEIEAERPNVFYSNAYSGEYVISGFADKPIGTDIEQHERVRNNEDVLDWMFPKDTPDLKKPFLTTLRWTLHEAIGKIEGVGLAEYIPIIDFLEIGQEECQIYYWDNDAFKEKRDMNFNKFRVEYEYAKKNHPYEAVAYCTDYDKFQICIVTDKNQSAITDANKK